MVRARAGSACACTSTIPRDCHPPLPWCVADARAPGCLDRSAAEPTAGRPLLSAARVCEPPPSSRARTRARLPHCRTFQAAAQLKKLIPLGDRVLVKRVVQETRVRRRRPRGPSAATPAPNHARARRGADGACTLSLCHAAACRPPAASCCPRPTRSSTRARCVSRVGGFGALYASVPPAISAHARIAVPPPSLPVPAGRCGGPRRDHARRLQDPRQRRGGRPRAAARVRRPRRQAGRRGVHAVPRRGHPGQVPAQVSAPSRLRRSAGGRL
jgi:hypothetical protein